MEAEGECCATNLSLDEGQQLNNILQSFLNGPLGTNSKSETDTLLFRFSQIVTRYQEQPQLLDPILESLVEPLAHRLYTTIPESIDAINLESYATICNVSRFLWQLSTVRGYKTVVRFMSNEVAAFEPAVRLLQLTTAPPKLAVNGGESWGDGGPIAGDWEARYVALMWLSMLALVPFDLSLIDSSLVIHSTSTTTEKGSGFKAYPPIVGRVMDLCKKQLSSPAATREMGAVLIGRLVTRPDMGLLLEEFIDWGCDALRLDGHQAQFALPGVTLAFATAFKLGSRDALLPASLKVLPAAVALLHSPSAAGNALIRKLAVKLIQRATLIFLPRKVASWRYQRGQRTLTAVEKEAMKKGKNTQGAPPDTVEQQQVGDTGDDEDEFAAWQTDDSISEEVETSIGELLSALADRDTVVRWSAAKGIGRIVERLPRSLGDEVVGAVLESFTAVTAEDAAWHGGCLALAELTRRGLLLPERLPDAVPIVIQALAYDVRRGPCSVGAHVRDAGAYVCWAFARAYSKDALGAAVEKLAPALITLACYDREINCRRAAAAAFQECVGRLGAFPNGIDIITAADYFTVSARNSAYLSVAPYVAKFPGYLEPLVWHLLKVKLNHWEKATREVTAKALAALVPLHKELFAGEVVQDSEVTLCEDTLTAVASIIPSIHAKKLSKGKGGEVMRSALCRLAETSSLTRIPLNQDQKQALLHVTIMDNLQHSSPDIQQAAAQALAAYADTYLRQREEHQQQQQQQQPPDGAPLVHECVALVDMLLHELATAPVATTRRGAALGLGVLPGWLAAMQRWRIVDALCASAAVPSPSPQLSSNASKQGGGVQDAETRVNVVTSLAHIVVSAWKAGGSDSVSERKKAAAEVVLSDEDALRLKKSVFEALLTAMEDYTTDNRGDIGSWVREASMISLTKIFTFISSMNDTSNGSFPSVLMDTAERTLHVFLKQSVERIRRVREVAGSQLLAFTPLAAAGGVSAATQVLSTLASCRPEDFSTTRALPVLAQLLRLRSLQQPLLEGLAFSAGGLDAQLSEAANDAAADACQDLDEAEIESLGEALLLIWTKHTRSGRMCTPLLLVADTLMSRTALADLQPPASAFPQQLLSIVRSEVVGCTDIPRLRAAAGVLCQLASNAISTTGSTSSSGDEDEDLGRQALQAVLALLGNRFPKVRRYTAELLYTMFLGVDADEVSADWEVDAVMELLESTAWDGPADVVRPARLKVHQYLGLNVPARPPSSGTVQDNEQQEHQRKQMKGDIGGHGVNGVDINEGYGALVERQYREGA